MPMVNKYGQKYHCLLPKLPDKDTNNTPTDETDNKTGETSSDDEIAEKEEIPISGLAKARQLLEPMTNQPCLLKTKDWWTYEFCYGKTVKQFHMEGN
jgi:protein OS-9